MLRVVIIAIAIVIMAATWRLSWPSTAEATPPIYQADQDPSQAMPDGAGLPQSGVRFEAESSSSQADEVKERVASSTEVGGDESEVVAWEFLYEGATVDELKRARAQLRTEISELAGPRYRDLHDQGAYEVFGRVTPGEDFELPTNSPTLDSFAFHESGEVRRVTLLEQNHPELYALKRQSDWLKREIAARR